MSKACCYCGVDKGAYEMRPYGPNGAPTCYDCAMATPERVREAERHIALALSAPGVVAFTETGIRPLAEVGDDPIVAITIGDTTKGEPQ